MSTYTSALLCSTPSSHCDQWNSCHLWWGNFKWANFKLLQIGQQDQNMDSGTTLESFFVDK